MKTTREEYNNRWNSFEGVLRYVITNYPIAHRIAELYACGEIITKEEALCQMVVGFARQSDGSRKLYEVMAHNPTAVVQ